MDAASEIKARISMRQIAEKYGIEIEGGGFTSCPFHDEKTPSLKIYDQPGKGFCCFGCGAAGSVIDFVMLLFRIGFRQAILRISNDFGISINNSPAGIKERRNWQMQQARKLRKERERSDKIDELCALHRRHWLAYKNGEPWSDGWCEALRQMPKIDYELEELLCTQKTII